MATSSVKPKIYHITHVDNLASIIDLGYIESDARRVKQGDGQVSIGMTEIKRRRLYEIAVSCHPGTTVGEYVPFYFCPRSIMLYILHMGNHMDIAHYRGGQGPVVHLQMDLEAVVNWANQQGVRWAFSDRNAGSRYADFYSSLSELAKIDWRAVRSTDFRDPVVKDGKQAEFLMHHTCPWHLVEKIGVLDEQRRNQVAVILQKARQKPVVSIEGTWYY